MGTFRCSDGTRLENSVIDSRTSKAKHEFKMDFHIKHNFFHCEECKRSDKPGLAVSHIVSVKHSKETGRSELCWQKDNFRLLCNDCHSEFDNQTNIYRELIYQKKNNL